MRSPRFLVSIIVAGLLVGACAGESSESTSTAASSAEATAADRDMGTTTTSPSGEEATRSASGGAGGDMPDPCALLTVEEIVSATGVPFDDGIFNEEISSEDQVICDWTGSEEFALVQVLFHDVDTFEGNRDSAEEFTGR